MWDKSHNTTIVQQNFFTTYGIFLSGLVTILSLYSLPYIWLMRTHLRAMFPSLALHIGLFVACIVKLLCNLLVKNGCNAISGRWQIWDAYLTLDQNSHLSNYLLLEDMSYIMLEIFKKDSKCVENWANFFPINWKRGALWHHFTQLGTVETGTKLRENRNFFLWRLDIK